MARRGLDGVEVVNLGRRFDVREKTGEESGKAFGEEVGRYPCLMAEVVACQGGFVELDVHCF